MKKFIWIFMITNILAKASSLKVNNKIVKIRQISAVLAHFKIFNNIRNKKEQKNVKLKIIDFIQDTRMHGSSLYNVEYLILHLFI